MLEASGSTDAPGSGRKRSKSSSVYTDTVTVQIGPGVQICPAIFVPSQKRIPQAVKYIYSRLAACACEIDQGVPDLVLSLVSSGNAFSQSFRKRLETSLSRLIGQCAVWIVTSGEKNDPLAQIASNAQQTILNEKDCEEETLSIIVNSTKTVCHGPGQNPSTSIVDSRFNTLFMLLNSEECDPIGMARFKAYSAVKLANPPPALLIGIREERSHPTSGGQTPSGLSMSQQAIILPSSPSSDKHPVPVALFAGADFTSLIEVLELVKCSIPVLVIQESSKLCTILRSSWLHYHKGGAAFDHLAHRRWLLAELGHMGEAQKAVDVICEILSVASGDNPLIGFISVDQVENNRLVDSLLELTSNSAGDVERLRQVVRVAAKLNVTSVVAKTDLDGLLDPSNLNAVWSDAMKDDSRLQILSVLLDQQVQLSVTPDILMNLLAETHDQFFFNTIILGQCLRYSHSITHISERFIADVNRLMEKLSEGMTSGCCTFFPMSLYAPLNRNQSIQILCIWALMLHRTELAKCLAAYLNEPIPMALVLARVAKSLAHMSHDWVFYEESLNQLNEHFSSFAVKMLDKTHKESTDRSYQLLCRSIPGFGNSTMSQLAFLSNNKAFISHECCQRWLLRLLYGNIHVRSTPGSSISVVPKWAKILLSALLVFPTRIWIFSRSNTTLPGVPPPRPISPTVALLESGRQHRRTRAVSMVSLHSGKSDTREEKALLTIGGVHDEDSPPSVVISGGNGNGAQHGMQLEHLDSEKKRRRKRLKGMQISRCSAPPPLKEFYSTPIVKYWISLVFRLAYLLFFAYSITIPGCGNLYVDLGVWLWTFTWWAEAMWVFTQRKKQMPFEHGSWYIFDIVMVFLQLILFFLFRLGEHNIPDGIPIAEFAYGSRIVSSFFLLYQCYATLFYYIPLSDTLGPFLVRVKLMLLRDFLNFFVFVALVILSNAIAVSAIVYPDREGPLKLLPRALSWAWLMLFTTDLSPIRQSDHCRNSLLATNRADTCTRVGGIADAECPTQSWAGYAVVIEYLIVLKLICYPILFALFAKTAKSVDDEAKSIYRYQLYSLVADFSQRPFSPPPLTPIFFIGAGCCRALSKCMRLGTDHPDVKPPIPAIGLLPGSTLDLMDRKSSTVYRNLTMPTPDEDPNAEYCKRMAVDMWKAEATFASSDADSALTKQVRQLSEQLDLLRMSASFTSDRLAHETDPVLISYADSPHAKKIVVCHTDRPWSILSPRYSPPSYSKPVEEFSEEERRFIDHIDGEGHLEMLRQCRQKQISELVAGEKIEVLRLGNGGLPLNPNGRTGISGRGMHWRFGANQKFCFVIILGDQVLMTSKGALPTVWRMDHTKRLDELLATVLKAININENEAQILSTHAHLPIGQRGNNIAHVSTRAYEESIDTDNAWTELDVWAVRLHGVTVPTVPTESFRWMSHGSLTLKAPFTDFVTDAFAMLPY